LISDGALGPGVGLRPSVGFAEATQGFRESKRLALR